MALSPSPENRAGTDPASAWVRRHVLWVFLAVSLVFYLSSAYITSSNDGSHFALVSALGDHGSVIIDPYVEYTQNTDFCYKDGHFYSDRPPGTALLALPFYELSKLATHLGPAPILSRHVNLGEVFVIFLPNLAGTLVVWLLYRFALHFGATPVEALVTALAGAFATPIWFEATHLFSHIVSMATVLGAAYVVITARPGAKPIVAAGLLLGLASIVEIQNVLFVLPFTAYVIYSGWNRPRRDLLLSLALAAIAFAAVYSVLFIYNYAAFHELTIKSNKYNPKFPEEVSMLSALSGNALAGLDRLFTSFGHIRAYVKWSSAVRNQAPGLFVLSPFLLLAIPGYRKFLREHRAEALLFLSLIALSVAIAATHRTVLTRHIATIVPLLVLPCLWSVREGLAKAARWPLLLIAALFILSAARVFYVMNSHWGRSLSHPFPFAAELPSFALELSLCVIASSLWRVCKRASQRKKTAPALQPERSS